MAAAETRQDRAPADPGARHRIVIVGGGAGGLELVTKLGHRLGRRGRAEIVLVDCSPTHLWKPLLHEVAAGSLNSYQDELGYIAHARRHGYRYHYARMDGLDRAGRRILLAPMADERGQEVVPRRMLSYDTLVIAVGSTANDFATPGAREHCRFLDSRDQAEALHHALMLAVLRGVSEPGAGNPPAEPVRIAVIGGGATGVELAAELRCMGEEMSRYGVAIRPDSLQVTVIEAAPRILPALPERLSASTAAALKHLGVETLTGARVVAIGSESVRLADGRVVPATLKVWTAGIKAPDFLKNLDGLETDRSGRLVVRASLQTTRDDAIFAFGDCAACPQPGSTEPVPARAQAAHQEAAFLVGCLAQRLRGRTLPAFRFRDFGSLISLARFTAVGTLMGGIFRKTHRIEGWLARIAYMALYRMHQVALHGLWRTAILILTNRLQRVTQPRMKMH